jgi:hypothetical protein
MAAPRLVCSKQRLVYVSAVSSQGATHYAKPEYPKIGIGTVANGFVHQYLMVTWRFCHSIRTCHNISYSLGSAQRRSLDRCGVVALHPGELSRLERRSRRQILCLAITAHVCPSISLPSIFANAPNHSRCIQVELYFPQSSLPALSCPRPKLFNSPARLRPRNSTSRNL